MIFIFQALKKITLSIYLLSLAVPDLHCGVDFSLVVANATFSSCGHILCGSSMWVSRCGGVSCCRVQAIGYAGFSCCDARAQ